MEPTNYGLCKYKTNSGHFHFSYSNNISFLSLFSCKSVAILYPFNFPLSIYRVINLHSLICKCHNSSKCDNLKLLKIKSQSLLLIRGAHATRMSYLYLILTVLLIYTSSLNIGICSKYKGHKDRCSLLGSEFIRFLLLHLHVIIVNNFTLSLLVAMHGHNNLFKVYK